MRHIKLVIVICLAISGCATVASSGVQRIGQDMYTVTTSMNGLKLAGEENSAKTRTKALSDANAFCANQGGSYAAVTKEDIVRNETATAVIYFKCEK